jgi:hypothetical protein
MKKGRKEICDVDAEHIVFPQKLNLRRDFFRGLSQSILEITDMVPQDMSQPLYITSLPNHQNNVTEYHSILNYVHDVTKNSIFTEARVLNAYC